MGQQMTCGAIGSTWTSLKVCTAASVLKSAWSAIPLHAEVYESELERMNVAMNAENRSLQHDNKQLNTMIKEYEQTLETLMSTVKLRSCRGVAFLTLCFIGTFRNRAVCIDIVCTLHAVIVICVYVVHRKTSRNASCH
jgi:hypothetical protein